ncbi:sigma-54-dependent transcriptional regulator [Fusobacterium russii]|uniref:sigma-54-dependent transcriptional regulator n=1 Tax=Fusobacterium russii TaxID=854 RepID=UPI0003A15380|nr:sigma-54 dependent transcriptional regulator [Fusobacterium russii]
MKNTILAISEKKEVLKQIRKELSEKYEVITFSNLLDAIDMIRESDFEIVLLDNNLTSFKFAESKKKLSSIGKDFVTIALVENEEEETIKEIKRAGIYAYLLKPVKLGDLNKIVIPSLNGLELMKENKRLEERLLVLEEDTDIIGQSAKIKDVKTMIEKVADSDLPILIVGETGVGKDIVAKEIYRKSDRNKGKYAQISCAIYPGELIERELFGYERGAFLGANASKKGILEEIDGGTIYIEDISKMDIKIQTRLLKAIEYGEFKRVGGTKVRKSNVRFLVGTDIDLKEETEKGKFRKDLFHRLTAFPIEVPPLRERKEDIPILANYFLNKVVRILHKETPVISGEAMKFLMEYYYPGNIMELKNLIERMALLSKEKILDVDQLPLEIKTKSNIVENKTVIGVGPLKEILEQEIYSLEDVERVVIAIALQKTRWNKQETSKILGIGRTTLYEKIRKYGLDIK